MYKIVKKQELNPTVTLMEVDAPFIARKAEPGQFIILRVDEEGERIPLTVADFDREKGTVTIIFQIVGGTTERLNHLNEGEYIHDFVGPLGEPSHVDGSQRSCISWEPKYTASSDSAIKTSSFWRSSSKPFPTCLR